MTARKAPRRWTSIELLLRDEDEKVEGWTTHYRSEPGRVEPVPTGHVQTRDGEWHDGLLSEDDAPPPRPEG